MKKNISNFLNTHNYIVVLSIFALGCFFRLYKFATIPFGINHDGSLFGLAAIDLWQKLPNLTPFYTGWIGETMYHYILGINFLIFGISPETIKLTGAIIGIISLSVFYFLAINVQKKQAALFSLFFLSISGLHIIMGKSGWSVILIPLFQSLTSAFLLLSLRSKKITCWAITGLLLGLSLYTYGAARIFPVAVFVSIFAYAIYKKEPTKPLIKRVIIMTTVFVLVSLPLILFAKNNWETFTSRMNHLSITNTIKRENSFQPVLSNVFTSTKMLHFRANGDDFFVNEPLLELIPGIIFIIGLITAFKKIQKYHYAFILIWFLLGFIPGILSAPNGNHNFAILAPAYLIIGEGTAAIFFLIKEKSKNINLAYSALVLIILFAVIDMSNQYFGPNRREIFGFYPETTIVAQYMDIYKSNYNFYLTDNYPRDPLKFITFESGDPFVEHLVWLENGYDFLAVKKQDSKGLMFFMFETAENQQLAKALVSKFPNAKKYNLWYKDTNINRPASLVVEVEP